MTDKKLNCWEFMNCGRGPNAKDKEKCKSCPVVANTVLDGFNQGRNAGRACWLVAGTFCKGKVSGSYAEKINSCRECEFYKSVHATEGQTAMVISGHEIFGFTHLGLTKKENEDRYLVKEMEDASALFAISDGLGGDVSSDYAAEIVKARLYSLSKLAAGKEEENLSKFAMDADLYISEMAEKHTELEGMATTLVCGVLKKDILYWLNAGDSRLYIFRGNELYQITQDQTLARLLVDEGEMTWDQAKHHYSKDVLDQCIGYGDLEPQTGRQKLLKEDLLIFSTDGLYKMVSNSKITQILNGSDTIEAKTKTLAKEAIKSGGKDNITIVVVRIN